MILLPCRNTGPDAQQLIGAVTPMAAVAAPFRRRVLPFAQQPAPSNAPGAVTSAAAPGGVSGPAPAMAVRVHRVSAFAIQAALVRAAAEDQPAVALQPPPGQAGANDLAQQPRN